MDKQPSSIPSELWPPSVDASSLGAHELGSQTMAGDSSAVGKKRVRASPHAEGTLLNGRYQVRRVLGEGGMGVVYLAADQMLGGKEVALKCIGAKVLEPKQLALFKAEFRTMTELRHPHLASVHDFGSLQNSEDYFYTMDFVAGEDVYRATTAGDQRRTIDLVVETARALAYVHSRRIIHFDIKPSNVMLDGDGRVKVLDFGVAGTKPSGGMAYLRGTPQYMAPELALPDSPVDHRVDFYSLGIMLYQLLLRRLPFESKSLSDLIVMHHSAELPFDDQARDAIPEWLRHVILRLCEKNPADRYRSASALIEDIAKGSGGTYAIDTEETRESYVFSSRFVGRSEDLDRVMQVVMERTGAQGDALPMLLVAGPSGMGKSRLMREVRHRAQLSRIFFVEASCYEGMLAEHGPLSQLLGHAVRVAQAIGRDDLLERFAADIVRVNPELRELLGADPSTTLGDLQADRFRLLDQLSSFLIAASASASFVFYVNDLQWAQNATIDLFLQLTKRIRAEEKSGGRVRIALLGSYRSDEVKGRPIEALLEQAMKERAVEVLQLQPLAPGDVTRVLQSMLGVDDLPNGFAERVTEETGGNPFFVEEIMRSLVERGKVFLERGQWRTQGADAALEIPDAMMNLLERRAETIDAESRELLRLLAICNRPVSVSLLGALTGSKESALLTRLAALTQRQMAVRIGARDPVYRIRHDRLREGLSGGLSQEERRALHLKIAEALVAQGAAETVEVAHHYWHANQPDKAREYALLAADRAERNLEWDVMMEQLGRALEVWPRESDPEPRRRVIERAADAARMSFRYEASIRWLEGLLQENLDPDARARAERRLAHSLADSGRLEEALPHYWRGLACFGVRPAESKPAFAWALAKALCVFLVHRWLPWAVRKAKDPRSEARMQEQSELWSRLMWVYWFTRPARTVLPMLNSINIGERARPSANLAWSYCLMSALSTTLTRYRDGERYADLARDTAVAAGSPLMEDIVRLALVQHRVSTGQLAQAAAVGLEVGEKLAKAGRLFEGAMVSSVTSLALELLGDLAGAVRIIDTALHGLDSGGREASGGQRFLHLNLAMNHSRLGNFALAEERLASAEAHLAADPSDKVAAAMKQMTIGELRKLQGRSEEALAAFESAARLREENRIPQDFLLVIYSHIAGLLLDHFSAGDVAQTRERLETIASYVRKAMKAAQKHVIWEAPARVCAARLLWHRGQKDKARTQFREAQKVAERMGAKRQLAAAYFEAGRCALADGEKDAGRAAIERAIELYRSSGERIMRERAQRLLTPG